MISYFTILTMQGAITKRMTAIEEMAGMDVLCSDKTGTLTLNKLTVDKNLIEVSIRVQSNALIARMLVSLAGYNSVLFVPVNCSGFCQRC